jgi:hypothetical protein
MAYAPTQGWRIEAANFPWGIYANITEISSPELHLGCCDYQSLFSPGFPTVLPEIRFTDSIASQSVRLSICS